MNSRALLLYCFGSLITLWLPNPLITLCVTGVCITVLRLLSVVGLLPIAAHYRSLAYSLSLGAVVASGHFYFFEHAKIHEIDVREIGACVSSNVTHREDSVAFEIRKINSSGGWPQTRYRSKWFIQHGKTNSLAGELSTQRAGRPVADVAVSPVSSKSLSAVDSDQDWLAKLHIGSCWRLTIKSKPPRAAANEVASGYERWLFAKKIHGIASVRTTPAPVFLGQHPWLGRWHQLRVKVQRNLEQFTEDHDSAPLVSALAVGLRDQLKEEHWDVLKRTGTAHLMAISGLHVGLAAVFGFALGRYLLLPLFGQRFHLLDWGSLSALVVAFTYAALAGFAIATTRAFIMLLIWYSLRWLRINTTSGTSLLIAVAIIITVDPFAMASNGFWLSVGAVAIIIWMAKKHEAEPQVLSDATTPVRNTARLWWQRLTILFRLQITLTLFLMPFSALVSGGVSWLSAPVNMVLIPLFSLVIVPLVLILLFAQQAVPALAEYPASVLVLLLDNVWLALQWLTQLPFAYTQFNYTGMMVTVPLALLACAMLLPSSWPMRPLAVLLVLPVLFSASRVPKNGEFWVDVLDVGQALAVVIQTPLATVIYDTGNKWRSGDSAQQVIVPLLKKRGVHKVDELIISHADRDHAGGALSVSREFSVARTWVGEPVAGLTSANYCARGQIWWHDGVRFEFLHPDHEGQFDGNQQSCVLLISTPKSAVLLTGDLGAVLERRVLARLPTVAPKIDLVIGAHHGSLTSSDPRFVRQLEARYVVFSSGYGNQWGMPRDLIVDRWRGAGTHVLQTAQDGQIGFIGGINQGLCLAYTERQRQNGIWHWSP